MRLGAEEARVLGSLVEKQLTTPQQYPLTLNALVGACNQSSNRDPVVVYDDNTVMSALDGLKERKLVRFVLPSHGRSVVRYRHVLDETLALDLRQCALVAVLLLRGPQTPGELRSRTERMTKFERLEDLEHELHYMASRDDPVVSNVGRQPGQKEERWQCSFLPRSAVIATTPPGEERDPVVPGWPSGSPMPEPRSSVDEALEQMRREMAELRSDLEDLRREIDSLRHSLGD